MKRLLSLLVVIAMVFSLGATVFAAKEEIDMDELLGRLVVLEDIEGFSISLAEGSDGKIYYVDSSKIDLSTLYVDNAWADKSFGDTFIVDGKELVFGINAYADFPVGMGIGDNRDAVAAEFLNGVQNIVFVGGNTTAYNYLRLVSNADKSARKIVISSTGSDYAFLDYLAVRYGEDKTGGQLDVEITAGSKIKINDGFVNPNCVLTVNGDLYVEVLNNTFYTYPNGTTIVSNGASMIFNGSRVCTTGTMVVYGTTKFLCNDGWRKRSFPQRSF